MDAAMGAAMDKAAMDVKAALKLPALAVIAFAQIAGTKLNMP